MRDHEKLDTKTKETADESPRDAEAKKPRKEQPGADSVTDDNPLICRGID